MKYRIFGASILAVCFSSLPVAVAQTQEGIAPPDVATYPQGAPPLYQPVPPELALPAGTLITVRTTQLLSNDKNRPGDVFDAELEQPLVAQGWVVARSGQTVEGRIAVAQAAGRVQGVSQLAVELSELVLVDGQQVPVRTELVQSSGGTSRGRDAEEIGAATGIGAVIGAAAGGGRGAAIGAAAGAAASVAGVLATRGQLTELYPETVLTFRMEDPVTINTRQSQQAFQPVTQQDYDNTVARRNPPQFRTADASLPPPPYCYYSPDYWGGYPPPCYYGYNGYYALGPGFYVIPRLYIRPGFHLRR
jgi:hypothetical protein